MNAYPKGPVRASIDINVGALAGLTLCGSDRTPLAHAELILDDGSKIVHPLNGSPLPRRERIRYAFVNWVVFQAISERME